MKPGSKYYPLFQHLQQCERETLTITFAEIEALINNPLPSSALTKKNWWSNRDSSSALQAGAWIRVGYQVAVVDLTQQTVTFQKYQAQYNVSRNNGEINWNSDAIKALRTHKGFNQEQFASELGVRRATVSEWENSKYEPDRTTKKLLSTIAQQANFTESSRSQTNY